MPVPRDSHYVPQFFLRNFAVNPEKRKITTVAKHDHLAVWQERRIKGIGYERDLYVHLRAGVPVSVENVINDRIETPISQSDTWAKIANGRADALDRSDKLILYALIRHFEVRNPHYLATNLELAELARSESSNIPFTDEEREIYALIRDGDRANAVFNAMSASLAWTEDTYDKACISIYRSPIPLRSSTTPVLALPAPAHPALYLPLPGMMPYSLNLTLDRTTIASLVLANFDDAFSNIAITPEVARGFNRRFIGQFAYFEHVRHLIADTQDLITDMTWAPYEFIHNRERKLFSAITSRARAGSARRNAATACAAAQDRCGRSA